MTKTSLEEKELIWLAYPSHSPLSRHVRTGTPAGAEAGSITGLLLSFCSATFLIQPRVHLHKKSTNHSQWSSHINCTSIGQSDGGLSPMWLPIPRCVKATAMVSYCTSRLQKQNMLCNTYSNNLL